MILIEHATVLTLDADRRILRDGSVLVDGRDKTDAAKWAGVRRIVIGRSVRQ